MKIESQKVKQVEFSTEKGIKKKDNKVMKIKRLC